MDIKTVPLEIVCPKCRKRAQVNGVNAVQEDDGNIFIEIKADCIHINDGPVTSTTEQQTEIVDLFLRIDIRDIKAIFCGKDDDD